MLKHHAIQLRNKIHSNRAGKITISSVAYALGLGFDLTGGIYRTRGMSFEVPKSQTSRKGRGSFMLGTYEFSERSIARKYLQPSSQVLELGAGIGVVSCTVNKLLNNPAKHVVVEANPNLIPVLTRNRERNSCKFTVVHGAVSREPVHFSVSSQIECGRISESGTPIPSLYIEELEALHGVRFNVMIADIEGVEGDLLRQNQQFLRRLNMLIIEFHEEILGKDEISRIREILTQVGLKCVERRLDLEVYARVSLAS